MHRSSSNTRVADEYYRNSSSFFSSSPLPIDVDVISNKPGSIAARIEGLQAAGAVGIDGTQNTVHLELEEHDLLHQHRTIDKNHSI
uniref:Uncharacterized protein n=1 Tax=Chenopodium quinoa TaxID=63459 RepID=A0A803L5K8_CHEQI